MAPFITLNMSLYIRILVSRIMAVVETMHKGFSQTLIIDLHFSRDCNEQSGISAALYGEILST